MKVKVKVKRPTAIKIGTHSVSGKAFVSDNSVTTQKLIDGAVTEEKLASNLKEKLNNKQDKLVFDTAPTANSTNPVTSGGVKSALDGKADKYNESGGFSAGFAANSNRGGSVGVAANSNRGGSVGEYSSSNDGGAVGEGAVTGDGFAGGKEAKTRTIDNSGDYIGIDAIQLGGGTNSNEFTAQVYDYQLIADDAETKSVTDGSKYLKDVGKLSSLATSVKDNIVNAINSIVTLLSQKVDKVDGKGLSANDYTDEDAAKLSALPTKSELNSDLEGKQDKLMFDTTPTVNSTNPVTSGGVANAVENLNVQIDARLGTELPLKADKTELADLKLKSVPHKDVSGYPVTLADHLADEEFIKCNVYGNADGVWNEDNHTLTVKNCGKNLFDSSQLLKASGWTCTDGVYSGSVDKLYSAFGVNTNGISLPFFGDKIAFSFEAKNSKKASVTTFFQVRYADGTYQNIGVFQSTEWKKYSGVTNGKKISKIVFGYNNYDTAYLKNMQIEAADAATEYEPYTGSSATATIDTALGEGEYIDIINKKRYGTDGSTTDITVSGSLKTTDSAKNYISCDTAVAPSKIELSYYQDVNKVLSEITNAVLSQGGDV